MLEIKNLQAKVEDSDILKGLTLSINPGEVHAIMGPNGSGKSTLSKIITGHPDYEVTGGDIEFESDSILDMDPDERSLKGLFMSFQYPVEIPGVNNQDFLEMMVNAHRKSSGQDEIEPFEFKEQLQAAVAQVGLNPDFLKRAVNHGFSGGEKKRNEMLQMMMLKPKLSILDELDSGLDIDALKDVSRAVNSLRDPSRSFLIITHYQRLLEYIQPDFIHVMAQGKIVKTGDKSLALDLEKKGYEWVTAQA